MQILGIFSKYLWSIFDNPFLRYPLRHCGNIINEQVFCLVMRLCVSSLCSIPKCAGPDVDFNFCFPRHEISPAASVNIDILSESLLTQSSIRVSWYSCLLEAPGEKNYNFCSLFLPRISLVTLQFQFTFRSSHSLAIVLNRAHRGKKLKKKKGKIVE